MTKMCRKEDRTYFWQVNAKNGNYCIVRKPKWWGLFGKKVRYYCGTDYDEIYARGTMDVNAALNKVCSLVRKKYKP